VKIRFIIISAFILLVVGVSGAFAATTLDNLQTAFNGESNAHARYLVFADKAQQEGYLGVASLFRAAAKAEQIHADNHAVVIKKLGATPKATIDTPDVKSTKENIAAAVKGETYERDVMYPDFLKIARAEKQNDAIRTFNFAKTAEAEHAKLYTNALKNQENMKKAETIYVCTVCGYTTMKMDFEKCPGCLNPKDKYVSVS
jgi:rubrerythrin